MDNFKIIDNRNKYPDQDTNKLAEARRQFNKVFGSLKNLDLTSEYIKCRLKISNLSSSKRSILLAYVEIRKQNDPKFKKVYTEIDKRIAEKIKEQLNK